MFTLKQPIGATILKFLVLLAYPMELGAQTNSHAVILGGSTTTHDFKTITHPYKQVSVSPYYAYGRSNISALSELKETEDAARLLADTQARAVFQFSDPNSADPPSLYVLPFEVSATTQTDDWTRIFSELHAGESNRFFVLRGPSEPEVFSNLSPHGARDLWERFFSQHSTAHALALSGNVYLRPIADDADSRRIQILESYANDLHSLKKDPTTGRAPEIIDNIFRDLKNNRAYDDEIASLELLWRTDLRDIFVSGKTTKSTLTKFMEFIDALSELSLAPDECYVTVSTTNGPNAVIRFYKSLEPSTTAIDFGISKVRRKIERARWTFVSYRTAGSHETETGRSDAIFNDPDVREFPVVIQEKQ